MVDRCAGRHEGLRFAAVPALLALLAVAAIAGAGTAHSEAPAAQAAAAASAEDVVRALYKMVTFDAGKNVDWEQVKALFIPEAVIVLRASRTSMNVLNRNTFV
jgi:hypothetical protein